jgi:hypothetical protein
MDGEDTLANQGSIRDLKIDPSAEDLLESKTMQPYLKLAMAMIQGEDSNAAVTELAAIPLEKRYVWRVASALKWAFADFDTLNVEADRRTLLPEDHERVLNLLMHRPLQFCLFMSALVGEKQMETMMVSAIRQSRQLAAQSETTGEPR